MADLKLDQQLVTPDSLINLYKPPTRGYQFHAGFTGRVNVSQAQVGDLVQWFQTDTIGGTINIPASTSANFAYTLSPAGKFTIEEENVILGNLYIDIFEGTDATGSMRIFPVIGSGITDGDWTIYSGYDRTAAGNVGGLGVSEAIGLYIRNTGTADKVVSTRVSDKYIMNRSGEAD